MFNPVHLIQSKRDGKRLTSAEIEWFIGEATAGRVPDYQVTAFLMAVYFQGMTAEETAALTIAMRDSGDRYDLSDIPGPKVDKHSTGGIGDKVSIILAPLAAACGLTVPMMAGRGLGHSGGTLDKLESIPGFDVNLSRELFAKQLKKCGCAIIGQTQQIAPADKKLYALRDVTGTVECIPLIVASILSKKAAEGTKHLLLDVKVGNGAFMKTRAEAKNLASALIRTARSMGLPTQAVLTDMSQPLGYAVGNALEVRECLEILTGTRNTKSLQSSDLKELTVHLCARMLLLGKKSRTLTEGRKLALQKLESGDALRKFKEMVALQGGDTRVIDDFSTLPHSNRTVTIHAKKKGYLCGVDTEAVGWALIDLGGGRRKASDTVDPVVGFEFHKKLGSKVEARDPLVTIHLPRAHSTQLIEAERQWERSFSKILKFSSSRPRVPKLIVGAVG